MTRLYYTAPTEEAFEEMRKAAMDIWRGYDEPDRSEKLSRLEGMGNIKDNFMYIFAMFDRSNQLRCAALLSDETKRQLNVRLADGGAFESMVI